MVAGGGRPRGSLLGHAGQAIDGVGAQRDLALHVHAAVDLVVHELAAARDRHVRAGLRAVVDVALRGSESGRETRSSRSTG